MVNLSTKRLATVIAKEEIEVTKFGRTTTIAQTGDRGMVRARVDTVAGEKLLVDFGDDRSWVWRNQVQDST